VQGDQEPGEGQQQEGGRRAREPAGALELGEDLAAIDLEGQQPVGRRHPPHRGDHRHVTVVDRLRHRLAALGRGLGQRAQLRERALHRRGLRRGGLARRGQIDRRVRVEVDEQGLAGAGGLRVVRDEGVEGGLGLHAEGDHAEQRPGVAVGPGGKAVAEHRHRDHEQPRRGRTAARLAPAGFPQIEAGPAARGHRGRGPARLERPAGSGLDGGARHRAPLRVGHHDADVAVGGGHAREVAAQRVLLAALAGEQRAHRGERGQHLRVGAAGGQPARDEARAVVRDGGEAGLPVQQRGLALGGDLVSGEEDDEHGAGDEGADVHPRDALPAGGPALGASPLPTRGSLRHAVQDNSAHT
jgi:hypothetical protein